MLFGSAVTPRTTDEWYTPRWIFEACGVTFDMDVCAPADPDSRTVPAREYLTAADDGLTAEWRGYVWMNPPYSAAAPWVDRWADHCSGVALLPALPEVAWCGVLMNAADAVALLSVEFHRPYGGVARLRWPLILAAVGKDAGRNVALISAADQYSGGSYHVRARA